MHLQHCFAALEISGLDDVSVEDLTTILTYHVVGDNLLSTEISAGQVAALSGEKIEVSLKRRRNVKRNYKGNNNRYTRYKWNYTCN